MLAQMWDAFVAWDPMSQWVVISMGVGGVIGALQRWREVKATRAKVAAELDTDIDADGNEYLVDREAVRKALSYCMTGDHVVLASTMRWTADGEFVCTECDSTTPGELAQAVMNKAASDAGLAAVVPIFASAPSSYTGQRCRCGECAANAKPTHRTFDRNGNIVPAKVGVTKDGREVAVFARLADAKEHLRRLGGGTLSGVPGSYVVSPQRRPAPKEPPPCDCPRMVDTQGQVLRVDCDCPPDPMGFDCEHEEADDLRRHPLWGSW